MALSPTASISASQINIELGRSATAQFSWNDATYQKLIDQFTSNIDTNSARGSTYLAAGTNANLFTLAGSPATVTTYKFCLDSGRTIGGTGSSPAVTFGQFPSGSTVRLNNYGAIIGYGGTADTGGGAGSGGDAINANRPNQTVVINNKSGATVYGGGGGGGVGGSGGTGGTGGGGYYDQYMTQTCGNPGGYTYAVDTGVGCAKNTNYFNQYNRYYTSGGSGGGGGSGGSGGVGQGYNQSATAGSVGAGGSGGAAGGTNAGAGGTGGQGGTGGAGGAFGVAGSAGSSGAGGATGASGNNGAGAGGSSGAGGAPGGAAGNYLVKGAASVTFNNSGTVAGGLI